MAGGNEEEHCLPEYLNCYFQEAENGLWYQKIVAGIIKDLAKRRSLDQIGNEDEEYTPKEIINAWEKIVQEGSNPARIVKEIVVSPGMKLWWEAVGDAAIREEIKKDWRKIVCKNFADKVT